jgi:hypothetical protein
MGRSKESSSTAHPKICIRSPGFLSNAGTPNGDTSLLQEGAERLHAFGQLIGPNCPGVLDMFSLRMIGDENSLQMGGTIEESARVCQDRNVHYMREGDMKK